MSGTIQEAYSPVQVAVSASTRTAGLTKIGGFLAVTSGTVSVLDTKFNVIIPPTPVTAGTYIPMPFVIGYNFIIVTAGGASGVAACA